MDMDEDLSSICDSTVSSGVQLAVPAGNRQLSVTPLESIFYTQASLTEGCRLPVRMNGTDDWPLAEILSIKEHPNYRTFYVHYVDCKYFPQDTLPDTHLLIPHHLPFSQQTSGRMGGGRVLGHAEGAVPSERWNDHWTEYGGHDPQTERYSHDPRRSPVPARQSRSTEHQQ